MHLMMRDTRVSGAVIRGKQLTGNMMGGAMSSSQFADRAPDAPQLTAHDENHLADYIRLLDADDEGVPWSEAAAQIFGIVPAAEPDRAKAMHASHLARARWMTEVGYAYLLGPRATR
jgi:hypothetical protein